jgi:hypothetical protein
MYKRIFIVAIVLCSLLLMGGYPSITSDGRQQVPGPIKIFGDALLNLDGINSKAVSVTTENISLYVETTGNDENNCLTVATACATVQEAINRIPGYIIHTVTITVGAGTFSAFNVDSFRVGPGGMLTIQGTLGAPTITTGTTTGTCTGGSGLDCEDGGQTWTADDLRGYIAHDETENHYRIIRDNDADTFFLAGQGDLGNWSGDDYAIYEPKTIITGTGSLMYGHIEVTHLLSMKPEQTVIRRFKTDAGATFGIVLYNSICTVEQWWGEDDAYCFATGQSTLRSIFRDCYAYSCVSGFYLFSTGASAIEEPTVTRCYTYDNSSYGYEAVDTMYVEFFQCYSEGDTAGGWGLQNTGMAHLDRCYSDGGNYGVRVNAGISDKTGGGAAYIEQCTFENHTQQGIQITNPATVLMETVSGTGNTAGVYMINGGTIIDLSGNTITGTSLEISIDINQHDFDWADISNAGDSVLNPNNGGRVVKQQSF